jgi:peptide/nickel transport system permease protein
MEYNYNEILLRLPKKQSSFRESWRLFKANRPAFVGMFIVIFLILVATLGPLIFTYEMAITANVSDRLSPPNSTYWLGTDRLGRDLFARIINGAQISLTLGFVPTIVGMFFGMLLGSCAALFGKWVDNIIMRLCDMMTCIPGVLMTLMFVAVLGFGLENVIIAISITSIPGYTREIRAMVIGIVENDYIEAARACGTRGLQIMYKHVLINAVGPLILTASSSIASMIMMGAGLSFLGLGVQAPTPEWGLMIADAREFMRTAPYLLFVPGFAILISVLSFHLVGDGIRDVLDPRMRR